MKLHRNAKTTPTSRLELVRRTVDDGWRYQAVADGYGVSVRTVAKWVQRFRQLGAAGLEDGSSRPQQTPHITSPVRVTFIRQLREQHGLPARAIGRALRMPRSTVGAWLRRLGLSQRPIAPSVPIQRYEWPHPGDLLHVDIKPLGRFRCVGHRIHGNPRLASPGAGWEYVHVAVDDHTRLAYVEVLADQRGPTCAAFLERTVTWFGARHITSRRVMSDNGSGYVSRPFAPPVPLERFAICGHGPTRRGPTGKRSASFRRSSGNGHTCSRMRRPANAGAPCGRGCGITITTGHTRV